MVEIIFIGLILFLILTFFYKQAISDFRINQIEWSQKDDILPLLRERIPLVIRSIPSANFWTREDVETRTCFEEIPIFQELQLTEWVKSATNQSVCPWKDKQAEQIASVSGIHVWAKKWMHPSLLTRLSSYWLFPMYHCWAGNRGLHKSIAVHTCIFPVDGEVLVSIMPEQNETYLPIQWMNQFPSQITKKDTPFVHELKYIDIVLRPGHCLVMPPHWFVSWSSLSETVPMVCSISYHSPISYLAYTMRKK
jgi:hypothetical protein